MRVVKDGIDGLISFDIYDAYMLPLGDFEYKGIASLHDEAVQCGLWVEGAGLKIVCVHVFLAKITKSITLSKQNHGRSPDITYGRDRCAWALARG